MCRYESKSHHYSMNNIIAVVQRTGSHRSHILFAILDAHSTANIFCTYVLQQQQQKKKGGALALPNKFCSSAMKNKMEKGKTNRQLKWMKTDEGVSVNEWMSEWVSEAATERERERMNQNVSILFAPESRRRDWIARLRLYCFAHPFKWSEFI